MGPADSVKVSRDSTYSGYGKETNTISRTGLSPSAVPPFQMDSTIVSFDNSYITVLQPRPENPVGLGCSAFARRYLRNRFFFPLLQVREMFQFPGLAI